VWGDEQMLWKRESGGAVRRALRAPRSDVAKVLDNAPKYARFEITGRVRQVFLDLPWIEIESAQRLAPESVKARSCTRAARCIDRRQAVADGVRRLGPRVDRQSAGERAHRAVAAARRLSARTPAKRTSSRYVVSCPRAVDGTIESRRARSRPRRRRG